jgi:hypothetical protein
MQNGVVKSLAPSNGNAIKGTWQHSTRTATAHQILQFGFQPTHFFILPANCLIFQLGFCSKFL